MNPARGDKRGGRGRGGWGRVPPAAVPLLSAPGITNGSSGGDNGSGAGAIRNAQSGSNPARASRAPLEWQDLGGSVPPTSQKRLNPDCAVALGNCKSTLENTWVKGMTQKRHLGAAVGLRAGTGPAPLGIVIRTSLGHCWDIVGTSSCPWLLLPKLQHPSNPGHGCFQPSHVNHPQSFALWRSPKTFTRRDGAKRNPNHPKTRDKRGKALGTGCP